MQPFLTKLILLTGVLSVISSTAKGVEKPPVVTPEGIFRHHFEKYQALEHYSGAELSISIPGLSTQTYYAGQVSHDPGSDPVSSSTLFQIGSITKSFTSAIILQLEKAGKLTLKDQMARWLPEYALWSGISLQQMLDMTSGLPNYSDTPLWNSLESEDLARYWKEQELISFVYPKPDWVPPLRFSQGQPGYFYTNTGYILSGLIVEKAGGQPLKQAFIERIFTPAQLSNTYYPVPDVDPAVKQHLASGYNYNQYDDPNRVGADMRGNNLSWAGAAGGIVSNSADIVKWVRSLFVGNQILDDAQKDKLMSINSLTTGEPIRRTSSKNPAGFGLGIAQKWQKGMGSFWFYEGMTLGFRAVYLYKPCNGIIITTIFNSVPDGYNNHVGELMENVYRSIMKSTPRLNCGS